MVDVLPETHDGVARVTQSDRKHETEFPESILRAARLCVHFFTKYELDNFYVQGSRKAVHKIVASHVRHVPAQEEGNLPAIHQISVAIVRSQRAK